MVKRRTSKETYAHAYEQVGEGRDVFRRRNRTRWGEDEVQRWEDDGGDWGDVSSSDAGRLASKRESERMVYFSLWVALMGSDPFAYACLPSLSVRWSTF